MSIPQDGGIPESLEAAQALRQQEQIDMEINAQYEDPEFVAEKKAANLANSPYGPYNARYEADIALSAIGLEEHGPGEQNESPEQIRERHEEGLYTPIIQGFIEGGFLKVEEGNVVIDTLSKHNNISTISSITELPDDKKSELIGALGYIDDPDNKEQFIANFEVDFGAELGVETMTDSQRIIFDQIGSNYVLPLDGEINAIIQESAIDTALKTSLNQTIFGIDFERTESFKQLSKTIRDSKIDLRKRFSALEQIHTLLGNDQGKKGRRGLQDKQIAQKRLALREAGLEEQFNELQAQLKKAKNEKNTQKIILAQIEELIEKAELSSGDIFTASDTDIAGEGNDTTIETA